MDVYKIGVHLAMTNGVSPVLGVIAADLLGIHGKVSETSDAFGRWRTAIIGVGAAMAGVGILTLMGKWVEHGRELVHIQEQMRAAGSGPQEVAEATAKAWETTANVGTVSATRSLEMIKELRTVFGSTAHAEDFVQDFAKSQTIIDAVTKGTNRDQVFEAAKAIELRGNAFDPEKFRREIDMMTKAVTAYGGKVTPADFFQFVKFSRGASFGYSEDFMFKVAPAIIQEMGPSSAGTALKSMDQAVVGGKLNKRAAGQFEDLGLLDMNKVEETGIGTIKSVQPGAVKGSDLFTRDPYKWVQDILVPAMKAHGVDMADTSQVRTQLSGLFGNRTAEQMSGILATQQPRIDKDIALVGQAQGLSAFDELKQHDPTVAMQAWTTAWDNLMTALGAPLVPISVGVMNSISDAVNAMAKFASENPETVRVIGVVLAGLAAGLVAIGVALVGGAIVAALGTGGWLIPAFIGLGTAIGGLVALHWSDLVSGVKSVMTAIGQFIDWLVGLPGKIVAAITPDLKAGSPTVGFTGAGELHTGPGAAGQADSPLVRRMMESLARQYGSTLPPAPVLVPQGAPASPAPAAVPGALAAAPTVNIVPPPANQNITVPVTVEMDGRRVGQAVANQIVRGGTTPDSAAGFDGRRTFVPPDMPMTGP